MAFVVARPGGQWEIRESVHTPSGPRARTLATFRILTDETLDRASRAATRPFDPHQVRLSAWRAGAPVGDSPADGAARLLLAEISSGRLPAPALRRMLVDSLAAAGPLPELQSGGSMGDWLGASPEERGGALRDLLELADRLPPPRRGRLRFPRLGGAGGG